MIKRGRPLYEQPLAKDEPSSKEDIKKMREDMENKIENSPPFIALPTTENYVGLPPALRTEDPNTGKKQKRGEEQRKERVALAGQPLKQAEASKPEASKPKGNKVKLSRKEQKEEKDRIKNMEKQMKERANKTFPEPPTSYLGLPRELKR